MEGIKIEGLSKSYVSGNKALKVLDNIDLFINPNSFTTIIGPSGCAKSTLLQIVAGLVKADSGRVIIDGQEISSPRLRIINSLGLFKGLSSSTSGPNQPLKLPLSVFHLLSPGVGYACEFVCIIIISRSLALSRSFFMLGMISLDVGR